MSQDQPRSSPAERDQSRLILVGMGLVGVVLLFLFASPFSLFGGGDDGGPDSGLEAQRGSGGASGVPGGYEALSIHFDDIQDRSEPGPYVLTMPLLQQVSDGRNIGLYTFDDGRWSRVASATLVSNGNAASGEVDKIPSNLAVLRLLESAVQVTGWLPQGAEVDPDALEVLTTVNTVDHAPTAEGGIEGSVRAVEGTAGNIVPTVRAATPETGNAVNAILASPALLDEHVIALVQLSLQPGVVGVDIDYPLVSASRRADFTAFITVLANQLHQANRTLSVTMPAPERSGVSWDTGAYDWREIMGRADVVKMRPDVEPALYYAAVTDALTYLASQEVDLGRVALVVNRDSVERSSDGETEMSLYEALTLAAEIEVRTASTITPNSSVVIVGRNIFQDDGASGLVWDESARSVSFQYPGRGGSRTVYLENSLSLAFKLELAAGFDLAGVAISDVSSDASKADFWEPLRRYSEAGSIEPAVANSILLRPSWEAQAGNSQPEAKGNMVWTAPAQPGTYEVTLVVSDGVIRASRSIELAVQAPAP